jgi:hypothetical protein
LKSADEEPVAAAKIEPAIPTDEELEPPVYGSDAKCFLPTGSLSKADKQFLDKCRMSVEADDYKEMMKVSKKRKNP